MKLDTHGKGDDPFFILLNFLIISMCGVPSSFGYFDTQIIKRIYEINKKEI